MRIAIQTLGCKVNQSESSSIEALLREKGYQVVAPDESPDVCVINTCTVTARSDYQSRQLIRRAVRTGAKVIATGCYAELRPDQVMQINGVDLVIGNAQKHNVPEYLDNLGSQAFVPALARDTLGSSSLIPQPYYSHRVRAFLKIQDGCNLSCSYCTVPLARGKSRSLHSESVIRAVDHLSSDGYQEIVLTGVHIGSYGLDLQPKSSLYEIVCRIKQRVPHIRIRLSSLEPLRFDERLLPLIKEGAICDHLHIPLQSGSDSVLKMMKRAYTISDYSRVIEQILSQCPDISIGTDVIVGFPGERIKDFKDTELLLRQIPFSYIHVFPYSKRPGTVAENLPEHVDKITRKKRVASILMLHDKKKNDFISKQLGSELDAIVEETAVTYGFYKSITSNYIRPLIKANGLSAGQRLQIQAVSMDNGNLICTTK